MKQRALQLYLIEYLKGTRLRDFHELSAELGKRYARMQITRAKHAPIRVAHLTLDKMQKKQAELDSPTSSPGGTGGGSPGAAGSTAKSPGLVAESASPSGRGVSFLPLGDGGENDNLDLLGDAKEEGSAIGTERFAQAASALFKDGVRL
jgi:hypothetical protein